MKGQRVHEYPLPVGPRTQRSHRKPSSKRKIATSLENRSSSSSRDRRKTALRLRGNGHAMATSKQTIYDPCAAPHAASDDYCESECVPALCFQRFRPNRCSPRPASSQAAPHHHPLIAKLSRGRGEKGANEKNKKNQRDTEATRVNERDARAKFVREAASKFMQQDTETLARSRPGRHEGRGIFRECDEQRASGRGRAREERGHMADLMCPCRQKSCPARFLGGRTQHRRRSWCIAGTPSHYGAPASLQTRPCPTSAWWGPHRCRKPGC